MDTSLVLEDSFRRSKIPAVIWRFYALSLWFFSRWSEIRNFSEGPALSIKPFQKVQRAVIHFPYLVTKNEKPLYIVQTL